MFIKRGDFVRDFNQTMKVLYIDYYIYIGECANAKKQFDECFELLNQSEKEKYKYRMNQMDPNNIRRDKISFNDFIKISSEVEKREQEIDRIMKEVTKKVISDIETFFKIKSVAELKAYKKYAKKMLKTIGHLMYKNLYIASKLLIKNLKIADSYNNEYAKNKDPRFQMNGRQLADLYIRFIEFINNEGD
jgi:hypothetical protein